MTRLLAAIGRRASLVLAGSLLLGLMLPDFSGYLAPALPPIVVGLIALAMVRVDLVRVLAHLKRPLRLAAYLAVLMIATPLAVHGLALMLALPPALHMALIFMACAPPLGSAPNLAYLLKLDGELVFNITLAGTLVMPLTAPLVVGATLDFAASLDTLSLLWRLAGTIGAALLLAAVGRRWLGRQRIVDNARVLDGCTALLMVVFVIAAMGGVRRMLAEDPVAVLSLLMAALLANFGLQAIFSVLALLAGRGGGEAARLRAFSLGLVAGNRNFALFAAAIPLAALQQVLPFLALYQVPIYLTPLVLGFVLRRARVVP